MIDLLKKWSQLEPDRCSPAYSDEINDLGYEIQASQGIQTFYPSTGFCLGLTDYVIEAIANRGWDYDLHSQDSRHYASVEPRDHAFQDAIDNSAAIALLTAYVQALEAPVFTRPPADWSDLTF